jgi:hypothetical protein
VTRNKVSSPHSFGRSCKNYAGAELTAGPAHPQPRRFDDDDTVAISPPLPTVPRRERRPVADHHPRAALTLARHEPAALRKYAWRRQLARRRPGEADATWRPCRPPCLARTDGRQRGPASESQKWQHHGTGSRRSARTSLSRKWPLRPMPFIATMNKILPSPCYPPPCDQCNPTPHPSRFHFFSKAQYPSFRRQNQYPFSSW